MYETVVDLLKNRNCIDAAFPNRWESMLAPHESNE